MTSEQIRDLAARVDVVATGLDEVIQLGTLQLAAQQLRAYADLKAQVARERPA